MSTLTYAALTTRREKANPGTSTSQNAPGIGTYVDAFAALVPAEVLTLHALIITNTTTKENGAVHIKDAENSILVAAFYGLLALSIILYVVPRLMKGKWDWMDYLRALIPPLAFIGWTMLQPMTVFDAISKIDVDARTVIALFLAVVLGLAASVLAGSADQKKCQEI